MAEVSFSPLHKKSPFLPKPPYYYPTRAKLGVTLAQLEISLRTAFLRHFPKPTLKTPPLHDTLKQVEIGLGDVSDMLLRYLDVRLLEYFPDRPADLSPLMGDYGGNISNQVGRSPTGRWTGLVELAKTNGARIPSFWDLPRGLYYQGREIGKLVEFAEGALAPYSIPITPLLDQRPLLEEHLAWVKSVRLCIASVVMTALDYKTLWAEKDGDAGWALSEHISKWGITLQNSGEFLGLEILFLGEGNLIEELGLKSPMAARMYSVRTLAAKAKTWRNGCQRGCRVRHLGTDFPFTFTAIDPDLVAPGVDSVTMHARPKTIRRAWRLRTYWQNLIERGVAEAEFQVVVNAGTLLHGGAHPPHSDHRNGSMLDLDLTWTEGKFPDLVKQQEGVFIDSPVVQEGEETGEDEIYTDPRSMPPEISNPILVDYLEDWVFPPGKDTEKLKHTADIFTRCIYLTFPNSIIFASEDISIRAKIGLLDRLGELIRKSNDKDRLKIWQEVEALIRLIVPVVWREKSKEEEERIRRSHRNHWHVNYQPDRLGDESNGLHRSDLPQLADRIENALRSLRGDDLWLELFPV